MPRDLANPAALAERRRLLDREHILPLATYVAGLRAMGIGEVPDFDPLDGGVNARILFLLEKPGPMAVASGFISRDNDDQTAEAIDRFLTAASLEREDVVIWNAIPWWNGTRKITSAERAAGADALDALLHHLPDLRVAVLVGGHASDLQANLAARGLHVAASVHPSPIVRGTRPQLWASIPEVWAAAAKVLPPRSRFAGQDAADDGGDDKSSTQGSCLCGAVRYTVSAPFGDATACHCTQCRRQSGHVWASADVPKSALTLTGADALRWYQASPKVRRGFCATCGSFLFWDPVEKDTIAIALGTVTGPTATRLTRHIFTADKGDYYEIADGLPQDP